MISTREAHSLIKEILNSEKRYIHSVNVAKIMEIIAISFEEDPILWYLTGLLHDIDLPRTITDLKNHGLYAEELLKGRLPKIAIEAIKTHEHSTGLLPSSNLGHALIFSDMFEIIVRTISSEEMKNYIDNGNWNVLKDIYPNKIYHINRISDFITKYPELKILDKVDINSY